LTIFKNVKKTRQTVKDIRLSSKTREFRVVSVKYVSEKITENFDRLLEDGGRQI